MLQAHYKWVLVQGCGLSQGVQEFPLPHHRLAVFPSPTLALPNTRGKHNDHGAWRAIRCPSQFQTRQDRFDWGGGSWSGASLRLRSGRWPGRTALGHRVRWPHTQIDFAEGGGVVGARTSSPVRPDRSRSQPRAHERRVGRDASVAAGALRRAALGHALTTPSPRRFPAPWSVHSKRGTPRPAKD